MNCIHDWGKGNMGTKGWVFKCLYCEATCFKSPFRNVGNKILSALGFPEIKFIA